MSQPRNGERPLTARSVIASTLLGLRPPRLDSATLVRSGALFGISEGTTRVALSRMAAAGEIEADDGGYRLAGHLVDRQARQAVSRSGSTAVWDGTWRLWVVRGEPRDAGERAELRRTMVAGRLAELREGVWLRPGNIDLEAVTAAPTVITQCRAMDARPADPTSLAAELWELDGWSARADQLMESLKIGAAHLHERGTGALAATFVLSAAVLRHLQADPLLPTTLLPDGWPGQDLRRSYEIFDGTFTQVWSDWYHR